MNGNWFEIEVMMKSRQRDLLQAAANLQKAQAMRQRRAEPARPSVVSVARPVEAVAITVRLGGALVAIGRRLQGAPVHDAEQATCGVCGKSFPGLGPVSRA